MQTDITRLKEVLNFFDSATLDMAELALSLAGDKVTGRIKAKEAVSKRLEKARASKGTPAVAGAAGVSGAATAPKKRIRRSKEQIAADEAAKVAAAQSAQGAQGAQAAQTIPAAPDYTRAATSEASDSSYDQTEEVVVQS